MVGGVVSEDRMVEEGMVLDGEMVAKMLLIRTRAERPQEEGGGG